MTPGEYLTELNDALQDYRFRDVRPLTDRINPVQFELPQIKKALGLMRRKRLFPEMEHAAGLFQMAGKSEPVIRRQWSQSLLDQNRVDQALAVLEPMAGEFDSDSVEGPEIRGLIGRAYKQRYVNEGCPDSLRAAITAYLPDWQQRRGDYRWQGINLAALIARAQRDGIAPGVALDAGQIAQGILDDIDERGATGNWDYATGMEASVVLGDDAAALTWAKKYVLHPDTDAFELASTLRQLKEVWCLKGTEAGNKLLPVLEFALLQREGGSVEPAGFDKVADRTGFEAVYGNEAYVYLQWIDTLYGCCHAIGRIGDAATGAPEGTGFLLPGSSLVPAWGDAPVLLTNAHVISLDPADEAPLRPEEAEVEFTRLPGRPKVRLGKLLFSSPKFKLDITILRIDAPQGSGGLDIFPYLPTVGDDKDTQRIYVIGHPKGGELAVSLYDNSLKEYEQPHVRYRSPTEGGHSGSPVLTRQLKVFAIHHAARYEQQLNEGVLLNAVKEELNG